MHYTNLSFFPFFFFYGHVRAYIERERRCSGFTVFLLFFLFTCCLNLIVIFFFFAHYLVFRLLFCIHALSMLLLTSLRVHIAIVLHSVCTFRVRSAHCVHVLRCGFDSLLTTAV